MSPRVVIITRTKNRPILLRRAILSIADQSFTDYIHVIVNDGGNIEDVDKAILQLPVDKKSKIQVIHLNNSKGMEAASNVGIINSNSEFIVVHDDDDSWQRDFLSSTVNYLDSNPFTMGVATKSYRVIEEIDNQNVKIIYSIPYVSQYSHISIIDMCRTNLIPNNSFMFRRSVLSEIGYFDERLPVIGDWEFNLRFLLKYDIETINERLANFHHRLNAKDQSGNTIISGIDNHRRFRNIIKNRMIRDEINNHAYGLGLLINIMPTLGRADLILIASEIQERVKIFIKTGVIGKLMPKDKHSVELEKRFHAHKENGF